MISRKAQIAKGITMFAAFIVILFCIMLFASFVLFLLANRAASFSNLFSSGAKDPNYDTSPSLIYDVQRALGVFSQTRINGKSIAESIESGSEGDKTNFANEGSNFLNRFLSTHAGEGFQGMWIRVYGVNEPINGYASSSGFEANAGGGECIAGGNSIVASVYYPPNFKIVMCATAT